FISRSIPFSYNDQAHRRQWSAAELPSECSALLGCFFGCTTFCLLKGQNVLFFSFYVKFYSALQNDLFNHARPFTSRKHLLKYLHQPWYIDNFFNRLNILSHNGFNLVFCFSLLCNFL